MKKLNKKGQIFQQLSGLAVGIATLVILLTVTFLVIGEGREQIVEIDPCGQANATINYTNTNESIIQCCNLGAVNTTWCSGDNLSFTTSAGYNSTITLANATQDLPGWVPLIVIAVIGTILLGLVALFRRS